MSQPTPINHVQALPRSFTLLHYQIESVLGQGGFGLTYKAVDKNNGQVVVIKEHFPTFLVCRQDYQVRPKEGEDPIIFVKSLDFFLHEAKTLSRFNHANIVPIMNYFKALGTAYFVMPYLDGQTLEEITHGRPKRRQTDKEVSLWLRPILNGLQAIHSQKIIHRDIKPSNIFIQKDSNPVLIDFGSAGDVLNRNNTRPFLTRGYAPPEQYSKTNVDQGPWTDIYSLGATLLYCLTGMNPPDSKLRLDQISKGLGDPFEFIFEELVAGFDTKLVMAMKGCLRLTISDRIQGVVELWKCLDSDWCQQVQSIQTLSPRKQEKPLKKQRLDSSVEEILAPVLKLLKEIRLFLFKDSLSFVIFIIFIFLISLLFYLTN
jgi:serine/threonine protein kinase